MPPWMSGSRRRALQRSRSSPFSLSFLFSAVSSVLTLQGLYDSSEWIKIFRRPLTLSDYLIMGVPTNLFPPIIIQAPSLSRAKGGGNKKSMDTVHGLFTSTALYTSVWRAAYSPSLWRLSLALSLSFSCPTVVIAQAGADRAEGPCSHAHQCRWILHNFICITTIAEHIK